MSYVIEQDVPLRTGRKPSKERQTMKILDIGQSFLVPDAGKVSLVRRLAFKLPPKRFSVQKERGGWRVWRVG